VQQTAVMLGTMSAVVGYNCGDTRQVDEAKLAKRGGIASVTTDWSACAGCWKAAG
jgi:hypothetical protein